MIEFLADENFSGAMIRAVLRKRPDIGIVIAQQILIEGTPDPKVLEYAAENDLLLLSHDRNTMIGYAHERVAAGKKMPGLIIIPQDAPIGIIAEDLILIAEDIHPGEWEGSVRFLPL